MDFNEACARVREGSLPAQSIGVLKEKPLHATLKWWLDDNPDHHEIPLPCGKVADIYDGTTVTEVQTGSFSPLRKKLEVLLPDYPVTVVHPLVRRKYLSWIDPETGETTPVRKSPRVGSFADGGKELIYLLPLLGHPHLTVRLVLMDVEERRLADGWGKDGKRGSHRAVRIPLSVEDTLDLRCSADYAALLPPSLPDCFTAAQFGKAAKMQGRNLHGTLKVLLDRGVLTREKKEGNAWTYKRMSNEK
ncbi:MAG: hypothetical protein IJN04_06815 [Clostridia bacterium]|nr:hypothetical protein [Clostridia bacterium]